MASKLIIGILLIVGIITASLTAGCTQEGKNKEIPRGLDMPVAMVDGQYITVEELLDHPDTVLIVDKLIYEKIVLHSAEEKGFTVTDEMVLQRMQPYIDMAGGRKIFMERQHIERNQDFDSLIYRGRLSLLEEMLTDEYVEEPTYEEVVQFLKSDIGSYVFTIKGNELGKDPKEVTIEEAYDIALERLRESNWRKAFDNLKYEILPPKHESVNLMRELVMSDPAGEAWVAEDPGPDEPEIAPEPEKTAGEPDIPDASEGENPEENRAGEEESG